MLAKNVLCPVPPLTPKLRAIESTLQGAALMGQASDADLLHTATNRVPQDTRGNLAMYDDPRREEELQRAARAFEAGGGTVVYMPNLETAQAHWQQQQVWITPQDLVIPVCHEGMNRSQALYMALVGLLRHAGVADADMHVACPHGVYGGFYPRVVPPVLDEDNWYLYDHSVIHNDDELGRAYRAYFGRDKQPRIGEAAVRAAGLSVIPAGSPYEYTTPEQFEQLRQERLRVQQVVGPLLFSVPTLRANAGPGGRIIIFGFMGAAASYMNSLLERAGAAVGPDTFRDVVVVAIPFIDYIAMGGLSADSMLETYGDNSAALRDTLTVDRTETMYYACASLVRVVLPDVELGGRRYRATASRARVSGGGAGAGAGTGAGTSTGGRARSAWIAHAMQTHAALKRTNPHAQYKDSLRVASSTYRDPGMY